MSHKIWCKSIGKFEIPPVTNEDCAYIDRKNNIIAVSDGAGGGGVFADRWSQYLCEHLPLKPICSFEELDNWIESIWESFYNECEQIARKEGGLFLQKFYDEGSFATLSVVWIVENKAYWMTYGDSTVFLYLKNSDKLISSITDLTDYNKAPYLINSKDPLDEHGFKSGVFDIEMDAILFCASDAISHYIFMMYQLTHKIEYKNSIENAINANTKNSNYIRMALSVNDKAYEDVLIELIKASKRIDSFRKHLKQLYDTNLIASDDYSISIIKL